MRARYALLAAALLTAGAAYFVFGSKDDPGAGPEPAPTEPGAEPALAVPQARGADPAPTVLLKTAAPAAQKIKLRGTLKSKDENGPPRTFAIAIDNTHGERGRPKRVEGVDGKFEIETPYAGRQPLRIVSWNGKAVDIPLPAFEADADATRDFEVPRPFPFTLTVLDAKTKKPLRLASACRIRPEDTPRVRRLVYAPPIDQRYFHAPSALRSDAAGRIELPPSTEASLWVVAEDLHVWALVEARFGTEDSATVELKEGGQGTVRVVGWNEDAQDVLELRSAAGNASELLPSPDITGALYLMGVPPGDYVVALRHGSADAKDAPLATADLPARWEKHFSVNLDARGGGAAAKGRIVVTVDYPEEWIPAGQKRRSLPVIVEFMGDEAATRGIDVQQDPVDMEAGRPATFESSPLPSGVYRVEIAPFGWRGSVTVGDGDLRFHVSIPRPAEVVCRVRDSMTSQDIERPFVRWWLEAASGLSNQRGGGADKPGRVRLQVVPGRIRLKASASGHRESEEQPIEVAPGQTAEATFDLVPTSPLKVTVRDDGKPLSAPMPTVLLEAKSSTHIVERHATVAGVADWYDVAAGTYSISLAPLVGYEAPEAETVEIRPGEAKSVVIDVVRKP